MSYKIDDNSDLVRQKILARGNTFLRFFGERAVEISTPKTPYKVGDLSKNIVIQVHNLRYIIIWAMEYASFQERGSRRDGSHKVKNYTTPGTGPHFAKNAIKQALGEIGSIKRRAGL